MFNLTSTREHAPHDTMCDKSVPQSTPSTAGTRASVLAKLLAKLQPLRDLISHTVPMFAAKRHDMGRMPLHASATLTACQDREEDFASVLEFLYLVRAMENFYGGFEGLVNMGLPELKLAFEVHLCKPMTAAQCIHLSQVYNDLNLLKEV